jgi:aminoglycoside phosphotransferase (APT) family kinase protein
MPIFSPPWRRPEPDHGEPIVLSSNTITAQLGAWLAAKQPSWRDITLAPLNVQLGSGFSAEIFFLDVTYTDDAGPQARTLVLRLQPQNFEVVFGSDLRIQGNMMRALNETGGIPVPAWIGLEEDSSLFGAPFLVMGRVEGQSASQRPNYNVEGFLFDFSPAQRRQAWANAISAFAKLHRLDWRDKFTFLARPDRGASGLDQYIGYMQEWHRFAGKGRPMPIADAALAYVLENRPAEADTCVLWGDPTPSNTMFRPDGSVAALIDWELAALGPPELDLAWWLYFDDLFSRRFGVTRLPGLPSRDETIAIYEAAAGRTVRDMEYYDIVAALRMALVAVGAFDRQVSMGNIDADNASLNANLMTLYLAEKLNLPLPELGADFVAFMRNLTPVEANKDNR